MISLNVNGQPASVDADADTPLLWVLRDSLKLTGTKFGCGMAQCGACTVHLDGQPVRSCITPVSAAVGHAITTIEGLGTGDALHPVQQAWLDEQVPQCGYCQSGQIMSATALLAANPNPSDADIDAAMRGNVCRCGTYTRVRKAIHRVAAGGVSTGAAAAVHEWAPASMKVEGAALRAKIGATAEGQQNG